MKTANETKTGDVLRLEAMPFIALMNAARNAVHNDGCYNSLQSLRKCIEALEGVEPRDE